MQRVTSTEFEADNVVAKEIRRKTHNINSIIDAYVTQCTRSDIGLKDFK
jgi:hypothetical protein